MSYNVLSQNGTSKGHKVKFYIKYGIPMVLAGVLRVLFLLLAPVSCILYDIWGGLSRLTC